MKVYTKTGDSGETSLYGGKRVSKANLRIDSYGTVDELNSHIGLVRDCTKDKTQNEFLLLVQEDLFSIGAELATPADKKNTYFKIISENEINLIEKQIDLLEKDLEPLTSFILPGGHQHVSFCHIARTVCRRAERITVVLNNVEKINELIIKYLNRLSDYLFVLARKLAKDLCVEEIKWLPKKDG